MGNNTGAGREETGDGDKKKGAGDFHAFRV
jgi:hypothetical protein